MSNPNKNAPDFAGLIKDKFAMRKDIAPVETSATASRAYKVGDKFYYGNLLQETTQDIAQGGTLTLNTNYKNADPVTTSIQNLSTVISKNGAKNLLPNNFGSATMCSVVFVKNADGTITANGTTDAEINSTLPRDIFSGSLPIGTYKITDGQVAGTATSSQCIYYKINNDSPKWINGESEFTISSTSDTIKVWIYATSGKTYNNVVYKPMIRLASDTNPTYVPYAKSNKELTEDKVEYTAITPYVENGATASQALSAKTIVARNGKLFIVENDISSGDTLVEGGNLGNAKTINDIYSMLMANATYRRKTQGIGNHTKLKMSIPNSVLGNNAIINVKLWGQNGGKYFNSVVMVQCNSNFTDISRTHVKNLDDNAIAIDSVTIGSSVTEIIVSGFPTYIALGLEYMSSYSKPYVDWTFYGVD